MVDRAPPPPASSPSLTIAGPSESSDDQDDSDEAWPLPEPPPRLNGVFNTHVHEVKNPFNQMGQTDEAETRPSRKRRHHKQCSEWIKNVEVRSGTEETDTGKHDRFDVKVKALLDTGCPVNLLSPDLADLLPKWAKECNYDNSVKLLPISTTVKTSLHTATHQPLPLKYKVLLDIKPTDRQAGRILRQLKDKVHWQVPFYVTEHSLSSDYDMIIGTDTMRKCMEREGVGNRSYRYDIQISPKISRIYRKLKKHLKIFAPDRFRNGAELGDIMAHEIVRPPAQGPEGIYSSHKVLVVN
jgi:hypothetical protein